MSHDKSRGKPEKRKKKVSSVATIQGREAKRRLRHQKRKKAKRPSSYGVQD